MKRGIDGQVRMMGREEDVKTAFNKGISVVNHGP